MAYYDLATVQWARDIAELRRRLFGSVALILLVTLIGVVGFMVIDPDAGLIEAFFMTAITLTTVGYEEEIAVDTDGARVFTAVLILVGMGSVLYFVSTSTAFLLEGQLGQVFRRKRMERDLADMHGHYIVCGSGTTAFYAAEELHAIGRQVVFVAQDEEAAEEIDNELTNAIVVLGDPTLDDVLTAAGVERAGGLIACTEDDNQNVVITLTARHLNQSLRIVVQIGDVEHEPKVRKVGANAVVSPQHIGGMRLASELVRPAAVNFLDTMARDRDLNLRVEEVTLGSRHQDKTLGELGLVDFPDVLLLATRAGNQWRYNPRQDHEVTAGTTLVFLTTPTDSAAMRQRFGD